MEKRSTTSIIARSACRHSRAVKSRAGWWRRREGNGKGEGGVRGGGRHAWLCSRSRHDWAPGFGPGIAGG